MVRLHGEVPEPSSQPVTATSLYLEDTWFDSTEGYQRSVVEWYTRQSERLMPTRD